MPHSVLPEPAVSGLLARGREAAIYTVDEHRVLRRYDDARDVT